MAFSLNRLPRWALALGLVFFSMAILPASAKSSWSVRVWRSDDGLPNNNVTSVAQTADGFLWLTTSYHISSFDGARFELYAATNFTRRSSQWIQGILPSKVGGLWFLMHHGLVGHLNAGQTQIITNDIPDLVVQTWAEDADGALWVGFSRGVVCRIKDGKVTRFSGADGLPNGASCSLARDEDGTLWWAKANQLGVFRDGKFQSLVRVNRTTVRLTRARGGGVWIGAGSRLYRYIEGRPLKNCGNFGRDRSGASVSALLEDRNGAVWIGTRDNGLHRYDGSGFESVPTSHREISGLLEDHERNIWVATYGGGLNLIQPRAVELETPETGLPVESIRSLCEETNGVVWAATQNGLLICRSNGVWSTISTNKEWPGGLATCVAADPGGGIWVGTRDRLLHRLHEGRFTTFQRREGLLPRQIHTLVASRNGDLWIGGNTPESVQRLRNGTFLDFQMPQDVRVVRAMTEDSSGDIWVGTSKGNLLRISGEKIMDETGSISNTPLSIRCLQGGADGSLWIGYAGHGVGRLKDGHFARVTEDHGLYDNTISQIVPDSHGWIWFGADRGIFKVREQDLTDVAERRAARARSVHYGRSEGLVSLQANFGESPGSIRSSDGRVWIPTRTALAVINPQSLREESDPPRVLVKRLVVDEGTVASYAGNHPMAKGLALPVKSKFELPPNHRKLEFEFTALSFSAPENVRFQYQLEGFDQDWIDGGTFRSASYSRLAPGNYQFRVKACNSSGIWNEAGAVLAFTVTPFIWQTWWFQSATLALFTSGIVAFVRYVSFRRLRLRLQVLRQRAAVEKERSRIAKDIHDDLGGSLTEITLRLELALRDKAAPDQSATHVLQGLDSARQAIKSLDETVWAVNPSHDTLPDLINYIGQFAAKFLHAAGMRYRVDLPDFPPMRRVSAEVRHNLFLAVKEALNNVVRHSGASEVSLSMGVNDNVIELQIEDDGRGFDQPPDEFADGLRNMRQRMEDIGGKFTIESKPGRGAKVLLVYYWPD